MKYIVDAVADKTMANTLNMRSSANEYMLRRLYDPHYVHQVMSDGAPVQVCIDSRMLGVRGTGVAVYCRGSGRPASRWQAPVRPR